MKRFLLSITLLFLTMSGLYANSDNPDKKNTFGYPIKTVELTELRHLLLDKNFERLNDIIETFQKEFLSDFHNEYKILDAMTAFEAPNEAVKALLDEWVTRFPDLFQPYLARGCYNYNMGWESRGHKSADETQKEQFTRMEKYFSLSVTDLNKALDIHPKLLVVYRFLIGINTTIGTDEQMASLLEKAMEITPYSLYIRTSVMNALLPRWGGSYKLMDQFANETQKYSDVNPILKLLKGFSSADKANMEMQNGKYENAIKLYQAVLSKYDFWKWRYELANCYLSSYKYSEALEAINQAIDSDPQSTMDYFSLRIRILTSMIKFDEAASDLRLINDILPGTTEVKNVTYQYYEKRGSYEYGKSNYKEAITLYRKAIDQHVDDANVYELIGDAQLKLKEPEAAIVSFNEAVKLSPYYTYSYKIGEKAFQTDKSYISPNVKDLMYKIAFIHYTLEQYEEAAVSFRETIKLYPTITKWAFYYCAESLLSLGKPEEALSVLKTALESDTTTDYIHFELGKVYLALKNAESVEQEYEYLVGAKSDKYAKDLDTLVQQNEGIDK
jgi:tetratricopeptide (TPR) repeat protein